MSASGFVVKAYSSYYYVKSADKIITCTLRGRFKKENFSLLVGDFVEFSFVSSDKGVIEKILPRRTLLRRPMIANVDQVVLTFAAVNPDINTILVDRFLVLAELSGLKIVICINKVDIADIEEVQRIADMYEKIGYSVIVLSAKANLNVDLLRETLYDNITVLAGPSGAGKSTILNTVEPGLSLVTGEVSAKIGRGKHTTRYAQLLPLSSGGFVVDTPGFSFAEFNDIPELELARCFPEFRDLAEHCKFSTCLHDREPQCAVKQAVSDGSIFRARYDSYLAILNEIRQNKRGY